MIVVFDIGNVLLRWNPRNLYRKTFDDEARMERFLATALAMDFVAHTDTAPDFAAAVEARAKAFPEFAAELRLFHERWIETLGGPIDENVALLRRLKSAGRPVHALSNFATDKFALAREQYDFLDAFDVAVISGHVGAVKPEARIYEILFERVARRPRTSCSSTICPPTSTPPRRSAWPRSTIAPASIWNASSRPAGPALSLRSRRLAERPLPPGRAAGAFKAARRSAEWIPRLDFPEFERKLDALTDASAP